MDQSEELTRETKIYNSMMECVGRHYRGTYGKIYLCDGYDPKQGFWMTALDGSRRTNVSEYAIGRTYHEVNK